MTDFDPAAYLIRNAREQFAELEQLTARHKVAGEQIAADLADMRAHYESELADEVKVRGKDDYETRRNAMRMHDAFEAGRFRGAVLQLVETHTNCRRRDCRTCDAVSRLLSLMSADATFKLEYRLAGATARPE